MNRQKWNHITGRPGWGDSQDPAIRALRSRCANAEESAKFNHEAALRFKARWEQEVEARKVAEAHVRDLERQLGLERSGAVTLAQGGGEVSLPTGGEVSVSPSLQFPMVVNQRSWWRDAISQLRTWAQGLP